MTLIDAHSRILVIDERRAVETVPEALFASDQAGAIERILDDVADVAADRVADAVMPPLRQALFDAFATRERRAWHEVYDILAALVAAHGPSTSSAFGRLASFVAENDDLADELESE
jgi:hypothetical protein